MLRSRRANPLSHLFSVDFCCDVNMLRANSFATRAVLLVLEEFGNNGQTGADMGSNGENFDNYLQWRYMNTFNRIMPFMERTLEMSNGGSQFFMGDQMMWCDMMCYCCLETPYMENQSMFGNYPKLMALRTRVAAHPKIAGYLKSRPNTNW